jgi:hypothetical protein
LASPLQILGNENNGNLLVVVNYMLVHIVVSISQVKSRAGIFKESMGARNRGGRGLSYRPARLHRQAEFIPRNQFWGPIHVKKCWLRIPVSELEFLNSLRGLGTEEE